VSYTQSMFSRWCFLSPLRRWIHSARSLARCWLLLPCSSLAGSDLSNSSSTLDSSVFLRLCGPLTSSPASTCTQVSSDSAACMTQRTASGSLQTFDLGNYDVTSPPVWSYINAQNKHGGVTYTLRGAQQWYVQTCREQRQQRKFGRSR